MKILVLYGEAKQPETEDWFPEGSEFVHLDIHEFMELELPEKPEIYDNVLALHSLNKLRPEDVLKAIDKIYQVLLFGGELWAYTPSFEWIAKQAFIKNPSPLLHYQAFGTEKSPNKSLFNLAWLREIIVSKGFIPRVATQDRYELKSTDINDKDEKTVRMVQNAVIGWKTKQKQLMKAPGADDPTTAID